MQVFTWLLNIATGNAGLYMAFKHHLRLIWLHTLVVNLLLIQNNAGDRFQAYAHHLKWLCCLIGI